MKKRSAAANRRGTLDSGGTAAFPDSVRQFETIAEIVESGLCVGCGLCQAIAGKNNIRFVMTPEGRERPVQTGPIGRTEWQMISHACPGMHVTGSDDKGRKEQATIDPVWGPYHDLKLGHATDAEIRFRAASGGVLTALCKHLVESGQVKFILQVRASEDRPMRTDTVMSRDCANVIASSGSRYGPATPLASICDALDADEPFVFVGKPCDVTALRLYARDDARVDRQCKFMLALVCGGAPEFRKSLDLVHELGYKEEDVTLMRYRGFGNPGRARVEFRDGHAEERTYLEMWADESKWCIQPRCKICPDAIGESADIAVADFWPGGTPTGEDAGFSSIIIRTRDGERLLREAVEAGVLTLTRDVTIDEMSDTQPHQVRKKRTLWARFAGMRAARHPVPIVEGLRLSDLARGQSLSVNLENARGARSRCRNGRFSEPPARTDNRPANTEEALGGAGTSRSKGSIAEG